MKIGELARRSGLSAHTLRYYERIGLLPYADRNASGQRDYDAAILDRIGFLHRLKTTGMPIREMLQYAALMAGGEATLPDRRRLLEQHRERVRVHVDEMQACLLVLDAKIAGYGDAEARTKNNDANSRNRKRPTHSIGGRAH
jgi:DNA-binding transcriptional MerR regulator